jgi:hypothetical protein
MENMLRLAEQELALDRSLPLDHPERNRFNSLFTWMKEGGSKFDKLKLRYYT